MSYLPPRPSQKPVPERSNTRRGAACPETLKRPGGVRVGDPSGPEIGPRENTKTRQEYGADITETRHGQATRPPRPGQWA